MGLSATRVPKGLKLLRSLAFGDSSETRSGRNAAYLASIEDLAFAARFGATEHREAGMLGICSNRCAHTLINTFKGEQ